MNQFDFWDDHDRRVFVKGLGFVSMGLLLGTFGGCEQLAEAIRNRPVRRRLRVGSPEVDADVATYAQAVSAMKGLGASDTRSWANQAAIHGISTGFRYCQHGTTHFFDWHRAYLLFFERICQKLTGNTKFGLPYWNWNQNPDIHPSFLDTTSTLYLARSLNTMDGDPAVSSATLDIIFGDTNFFSFSQQIEGTPHNTVHGHIGGTMGGYASALDPIFWMHHCMVDYCWAKWNIDLGNNNTNDQSWVGTDDSHFVDADGNPTSVQAGLTTVMPLLSYQYESSAIGGSPAAASLKTKAEFLQVEKRLRAGADVHFEITQRIRLADAAALTIARPSSLQTRLSPADFSRILEGNLPKERIFLTIAFARLPATSDFALRVFLNLPGADANSPTADPHYAGSFAFFGTEQPSAPAPTEPGHQHAPSFLVNVTRTLQNLRQRQELKDGTPISVQLVAVPFAGKFEREDTQLWLESIDLITTPVIVNASSR